MESIKLKLNKIAKLLENPQQIPPTHFTLGTEADNIKHGKKLMRDRRKMAIEHMGGFTLWEFPRGYALINDETSYVAYYMKYDISHWNFFGRRPAASQVAVWRDPRIDYTRNLSAKIFFDHLLYNWHTVITDALQTGDGERFWKIRIAESLSRGLDTYFVSLISPKQITKIRDSKHLIQLENDGEIWGADKTFRNKRIVITTKPFKERHEDNGKGA